MNEQSLVLLDQLAQHGISRRKFLRYCATLASLMALPHSAGRAFAEALVKAPRPSVIWLSFQECTGCTEAITRSHSPTLEGLLFNSISLDYHHTLQAAAGNAAEAAREEAMKRHWGKYLLVVDGSVPMKDGGIYSTIAGVSNYDLLMATARGAAAVIAVGSCAAFGGLPKANPNPTGAVAIADLVKDKPVINLPGCPPIPVVMTGVLAYYLTFGALPELDTIGRPKSFYGETIHDRCYRRPFYDQGKFAKSFDDAGARQGWCLFELGCKGPITHNACATVKWNDSLSFPIGSGHGCLGCSEPGFWDGGDFYRALSLPANPLNDMTGSVAVGLAVGTSMAVSNRLLKKMAVAVHTPAVLADLKQEKSTISPLEGRCL
ncbi:hydrogenase 1 small subunit [Gammaproteobacteria bacterium]